MTLRLIIKDLKQSLIIIIIMINMIYTINIILHSNMFISFQLFIFITLKLPSISFRPHVITSLLRHYLDPKLMHALTLISVFDIQLNYESSIIIRIQCLNHSFINEHLEVIDSTIQFELQKKWIRHITSLLDYYYYSSIDLVSKKINEIQIEWRMIFNLFYSIDMSINDEISSKYREINYESLEKS